MEGQTGDRSACADGAAQSEDRPAQLRRRTAQFFRAQGVSAFSSNVLVEFMQKLSSEDEDLGARVRAWVLQGLNNRRTFAESSECEDVRRGAAFSPFQRGCPDLVPQLRSLAVWPPRLWTGELAWIHDLERMYPVIKEELLALRGRKSFQPYRAPGANEVQSTGTDRGEWNVFYLYLHGMDFEENRAMCPATSSFIGSMGANYDHAFFSAMAPRTHIAKHNGPTNRKLRCHLPLIVPDGGLCRLRVGDQIVSLEEGKCYLFDDSFEHEAFNDADTPRVVLIVDVWHPDLSEKERQFFRFLQKAQLAAAKRLHKHAEQHGEAAPGNFMASIEAGKELQADDSRVFA